ncbi:DEAD/DEAH box helicase [Candidatus Bathyarchaeota archaeon]|nr:DEAD/DEAH box helicase [Candidatus Bathyarchaeota archaeon]
MEKAEEALNVFSLFIKPIQEAIKERKFSVPTEAQQKAIPLILQGKNILLIAPTATGKTEAAILPVLNNLLVKGSNQIGVSILYITPLRALNRDMLDRLEWWCKKLELKVSVRHGDTDVKERSMQAKTPPTMLITTPETLQALLVGKIMKKHLKSVKYVIIDEVHELAEDKRGSQLSLALERLRWITKSEFQLIGLSATIGSPEAVAKFLVGENRSIEVIKIPIKRKTKIKILFPSVIDDDYKLANKLYTHPEVTARLRVIKDLIKAHDSVLLFTNTRAIAEVLASRFKVWDVNFPISIHHGSLAKLVRVTAEKSLKKGELKGLVCTSSLELGIDIGKIDYVIQYMSPRQVTRLIQRIGRSGHKVGRIAEGAIITLDSDDTLEAMVIARSVYQENLEQVKIPEKPFDVLTHQITGLLIQKNRWTFNEILKIFKEAYPYRNLTEEDVKAIAEYMHSRFPRLAWVSFNDKVMLKPKRIKELYEYYFREMSMIPDEKQYLVVDEDSDSSIGILDEAFIAEYGEPGVKFIMKGSPWMIKSVRGDKIYVKAITDPTGAIPSWIGEEIPVPFEVAQEVGSIRALVEESLKAGENLNKIVKRIANKYFVDEETVLKAISETVEHVKKGYPAPTDKRITIEDWDEYTIITCHFGTLVNRTLARLIGHVLSEELSSTIGVQQDAYRIVIQSIKGFGKNSVANVLRKISQTKKLTDLINEAAIKTGLFKRRAVHVARRFGALSKWVDATKISLKQLIKSFEDTIIFQEALKEAYDKDLDVLKTIEVLNDIKNGKIELAIIEKNEASPIARLGIEKIGQKTDLIPPEKMKRILIEAAKARILNEVKLFACISCWKFIKPIAVKNLPKNFSCPKCGSKTIGILSTTEDDALNALKKRVKSFKDKKIIEEAEESAKLYQKYGLITVYILAGKKLNFSDVEHIAQKVRGVNDKLFELIVEAEKESLKRRFW